MKNIVASLIIGIAFVLATVGSVFTWAKHKESMVSSISATGSASVEFESDLVKWTPSFKVQGEDYKTTYEILKGNNEKIKAYLTSAGISDSEIEFDSVNVNERNRYEYDDKGNFLSSIFLGYTMTQNITIVSKDIDKVEKASRESNILLEDDIYLESYGLNYYKEDTDSVKMSLIEKATQNAKERIDIMAREANGKVGTLRSSKLGVFQIVAKNSGTENYSYEGANDTSSRQKKASITVKLEYNVSVN